jgi:hypothetical protein
MATITSGNSTTFGVYGDQTITLNTTPGTEGTVTWNSPNGAQVVQVGPMPLVNKVINMNGVTSAMTVTCKTGSLTYDLSSSYLVSGGGNSAGLTGVTYDGSNRVTGYTLDGVTYTVTGWGTSTVTVAGSDASTRTITLDGSGRFTGVA